MHSTEWLSSLLYKRFQYEISGLQPTHDQIDNHVRCRPVLDVPKLLAGTTAFLSKQSFDCAKATLIMQDVLPYLLLQGGMRATVLVALLLVMAFSPIASGQGLLGMRGGASFAASSGRQMLVSLPCC